MRKRSNSLTAGGTITLLTRSMPLLLSCGFSVRCEVTLCNVPHLQELGDLGMFCNFEIAHPKGAGKHVCSLGVWLCDLGQMTSSFLCVSVLLQNKGGRFRLAGL